MYHKNARFVFLLAPQWRHFYTTSACPGLFPPFALFGRFCFRFQSVAFTLFWSNKLTNWGDRDVSSLRSKRFRAVSEQTKTEEQDSRFWLRENVARSVWLSKQHGNACYAGYDVRNLITSWADHKEMFGGKQTGTATYRGLPPNGTTFYQSETPLLLPSKFSGFFPKWKRPNYV